MEYIVEINRGIIDKTLGKAWGFNTHNYSKEELEQLCIDFEQEDRKNYERYINLPEDERYTEFSSEEIARLCTSHYYVESNDEQQEG